MDLSTIPSYLVTGAGRGLGYAFVKLLASGVNNMAYLPLIKKGGIKKVVNISSGMRI
ncbi:hypothetical protein EYZ11_008288 [Aspergillus tanneri]|uniref:Uncharacterized protein n=1 Tax=Aspergillus tanneri TaxID=1220188 RepID=A0A4S3JAY0_9EURO|nr:hypothetical protein EYZ11_008288 [Aspergillus tanneri]